MKSHFVMENCSMAMTMGLPAIDGFKPCGPLDILNNNFSDKTILPYPYECHHDCKRTSHKYEQLEYHTKYEFAAKNSHIIWILWHKLLESIHAKWQFQLWWRGNNVWERVNTFLYVVHSEILIRSSAMIQFYFESFEYPTFTLYQETGFDFLCKAILDNWYKKLPFFFSAKVGGWIGLAVGGSMISFIELGGFLCHLMKLVFNKLRQR